MPRVLCTWMKVLSESNSMFLIDFPSVPWSEMVLTVFSSTMGNLLSSFKYPSEESNLLT